MNVLLVHQLYVDPRQPGGSRHYELSRRLVDRGHRVTVVASDHCYLTGRRITPRTAWRHSEVYDGITVQRAFTWPTLKRGLLGRILAFVSFMLSSLLAGLHCQRPDVVVGTSPPIFQLASAWLIAVLRGCPFVLEVRDLWPAFAIDMGVLRNRAIIWLAQRVERFFYARAARIIVNSPAYVNYLRDVGVPVAKVRVIPNGVDPDMMTANSNGDNVRAAYGIDGRFLVTYAGALGRANDLETILAAAERLRGDTDTHLLLVGDGQRADRLRAEITQRNLTNVTLTGGLPKRRIAEVLAASDACLATLLDIPMFRTTYPNKVFDYMAAGRPTVLAIDGVIREVLQRAGGGICVPPGDPQAIAEAITHLKSHPKEARQMGDSARAYVKEQFHRDDHARMLEDALREAVGAARSKRNKTPGAEGFYARRVKRGLDLLMALAALALLWPVMLLIALGVWLSTGRPVLFVDRRGGRHASVFGCLKFRTMTDQRRDDGELLPDWQRVTAFGRFLRATSLDELPQLINVVRGEMSLVGPRPLSEKYLPRYTQRQARRHDVRPGLSGWAQVNGRDGLSWEEKFERDLWYVDHLSFWLDVKILALTLWQHLWPWPANAQSAPPGEFMGTEST